MHAPMHADRAAACTHTHVLLSCGACCCRRARAAVHALQVQLAAVLRGLLELPANIDALLTSGRLLPAIAKAALAALCQVSSLEPDAPHEQEAAGRASMLLAVLVAVLEHEAGSQQLQQMQEELVSHSSGCACAHARVFSVAECGCTHVQPHSLTVNARMRTSRSVRTSWLLACWAAWPTCSACTTSRPARWAAPCRHTCCR